MKSVSVDSYAKINLGLRVLGIRPDGFHDLETHFQTISIADQLEFEEQEIEGIQFHRSSPFDVPDDENLIIRAANLFYAYCKNTPKISISLNKKIPMGAGLGGGSSNAASTLAVLNQLHNQALSLQELSELAQELGSDVPFFLWGGSAKATGRGEVLEKSPIPTEMQYGVVLMPRLGLSTSEVFAKHREIMNSGRELPVSSNLGNHLELAAHSLQPDLDQISNALSGEQNIQYGMSGSGAAYYALFASSTAREQFLDQFAIKVAVELIPFEFVEQGFQIREITE